MGLFDSPCIRVWDCPIWVYSYTVALGQQLRYTRMGLSHMRMHETIKQSYAYTRAWVAAAAQTVAIYSYKPACKEI